jgi:hypothetical protein
MKKIVVTFEPNGDTSVEAFGFSGGDCLKATKSIEDALGKVEGRVMKGYDGGPVKEVLVTQ